MVNSGFIHTACLKRKQEKKKEKMMETYLRLKLIMEIEDSGKACVQGCK